MRPREVYLSLRNFCLTCSTVSYLSLITGADRHYFPPKSKRRIYTSSYNGRESLHRVLKQTHVGNTVYKPVHVASDVRG